jgi:daunorubicin resistance ABC transporter ATP-binding subunit
MGESVIEVDNIEKSFNSNRALAGVSLKVERATVLGLLGPNGAGKTTLVRILSTLLKPDRGRAVVAGYDVVRDADALRSVIGLAGQYAAVDELLTGRENLELVGRLYHLTRAERRRRADEVLERFALTEAGNRPVKTYSGGMRRRLDLGASLVGDPAVLILDEPTTGLDPRTRMELWQYIEDLVRDGTTLLLTTQYLEEADRLAHRIAVIDGGRVIAEGTADELKAQLGGAVLEVVVHHDTQVEAVRALLGDLGEGRTRVDAMRRLVAVATSGGAEIVVEAGKRLVDAGIAIDDIGVRRPSLDDVFLSITGHTATADLPTSEPGSQAYDAGRKGGRRRGRV